MARRSAGKATAAKINEAVESVKESVEMEPLGDLVLKWDKVLSTGSTLLDLAISYSRVHGGGICGGIVVEIYGRSGSGKTSVLSEICGSAQSQGGEAQFQDPEARLDKEYQKTYGVRIEDANYYQPDTVTELFDNFEKWSPPPEHINVSANDSLAALSTDLEMEKGDKMGMRRAKEFSTEFRTKARIINQRQDVMACSNQVRQGTYGETTPGGNAVGFYSSLRISINQIDKMYKEKEIQWRDADGNKTSKSKKIKRSFGIESKAVVTKSSLDKPYREVPIYIVFDYGIDDVRGNLQWLKDTLGLSRYRAVDKNYVSMDDAINWIEKHDYEETLREEVINLWSEVEKKFTHTRKVKKR